MSSDTPSLWRHPDFMRLWSAQTVSSIGARITREGLPMVAVLSLGASPGTLGILAALSSGPALIVGLAGGGAVDRMARRPVMVWSDLFRAAVILTIPVAAWLHVLSIWHLFAAAVLVGASSVLFNMADHAYLPGLIGTEALVEGNSKLATIESVAEIGGPALAGLLFQALTAPIALAVNGATYLASAVLLGMIRSREPAPVPEPAQVWYREVTEGIRLSWRDPRIRALFVTGATNGVFYGFFAALYILFAVRVLGLTTSQLGVTIAFGGLGALGGAVIAPALTRIFGVGPAIIAATTLGAVSALLIPLAPADPAGGMTFLILSQLGGDGFGVAAAVLAGSLRQSLLPQEVLGRVGGAFQAVAGGTVVVGSLLGGSLATIIGTRETLIIGVCGLFIAPIIALASPLRKVRTMEG